MASIILFNPSDMELEKLEILTKKENIDLKVITMEDLDQKMGFLSGIEGFKDNNTKASYEKKFDFTFAFFKDFKKDYLFEFIKKMRENKVVIDHKAGITETNINWTLRELLDENHDEFLTMKIVNEINSYLKVARKIKEESKVENEEIKNLVKDLNHYFQTAGEDFKIEVAKDYRDKLKNLVENIDK